MLSLRAHEQELAHGFSLLWLLPLNDAKEAMVCMCVCVSLSLSLSLSLSVSSVAATPK